MLKYIPDIYKYVKNLQAFCRHSRQGLPPSKHTCARNLGCGVNFNLIFADVCLCSPCPGLKNLEQAEVVASLNILLHGFQPERPILCKDGKCETLYPVASKDPILHMDDGSATGTQLRCALTEVRGDWKFLKDSWLVWPRFLKPTVVKTPYKEP